MNRLILLDSRIAEQVKAPQLSKIQINIQAETNLGTLTLNSPKDLNALSELMMKELFQALAYLNSIETVKVIILRSALPKVFCAGANIKAFKGSDYQFFARNEIFQILEDAYNLTKKPIIAAVNGKALGGGFQICLLADIILCSENAYFALPEINLGLFPGCGGTQRLTRIVGQKMAMRFILSGEGFTGTKASQIGVAELISGQNFEEEVEKVAKVISSKALTTLIAAKKAIKGASESGLQQGIQYEKSVFYPLVGSKAAQEGTSAFIEKRKPNFKGL